MRDAHLTTGSKKYYESLDDAIAEIAVLYPGARREGSVGAWSWSFGEQVVAEAWIHARRPGWWVRVNIPGREVGAGSGARPRWEHGKRCHGYWLADADGATVRWGMVSLPPRAGHDESGEPRYSWVFEPHGITSQRPSEGKCATLRAAKRAVEAEFRRYQATPGNCIIRDTKGAAGWR